MVIIGIAIGCFILGLYLGFLACMLGDKKWNQPDYKPTPPEEATDD